MYLRMWIVDNLNSCGNKKKNCHCNINAKLYFKNCIRQTNRNLTAELKTSVELQQIGQLLK